MGDNLAASAITDNWPDPAEFARPRQDRQVSLACPASGYRHGEILVVEGWAPYSTLEQAISIFNDYDYQLMVTTGGPRDERYCFPEHATYAELYAATLRQLGVSQSRIVSVPAQSVRSNRTYVSALAVKQWLEQSNRPIESLEVFSHGVHARISQWLFQRAIGGHIEVGIIAAPPEQYDADNWWNWSSGVRSVVNELVAHLYARFLFSPRDQAEA